jgi:phage tail sheath protein FI
LTTVLEAKTRLTHAERDDLYEERVNPIASFPGQGVVVFGQKTLQSKPSALDRINVRRLLIALKKFIASSSRYLVFEQNTVATRNRFLNIVNPYLESVQSNSGLSAFRVVMDETNKSLFNLQELQSSLCWILLFNLQAHRSLSNLSYNIR